MATTRTFEGMPVISWAIDDWEQFKQALKEERPSFDLDIFLNNFKNNVYIPKIEPLFIQASTEFNLGGKEKKQKIVATEKPTGIFDFSLAARGLYKVQEYFSPKLAEEYPNKFEEYETPSGVVPPNLVKEKIEKGEKIYYYEDNDGYFPCIKEQKGKAGIRQGVQGAKLQYATKSKKVYLTYKRNKGKVKYVEIYSLFYYTDLSGDLQYAIRHLPALMVAEYLESMGIMTRIYMTRFVTFDTDYKLKEYDGVNKLPLYDDVGKNVYNKVLYVQPIIAKDFGEEINKPLAFAISATLSRNDIYEIITYYGQKKEIDPNQYYKIQTLGQPRWRQEQYFVGIERYRNKYKKYVDLGIFKSKEVLPEAMMFFHDFIIKSKLDDKLTSLMVLTGKSELDSLLNPNVLPFFSWWMRLSANFLKDKINIINSNELQKDIILMKAQFENLISELDSIVGAIDKKTNKKIKDWVQINGIDLLESYVMIDSNKKPIFRTYMTKVTSEITTYADGNFYATDLESKEKRDELLVMVMNIVSSIT